MFVAIDGGNDTGKPVHLVECLVENPQLDFIRVEKRTPKKGKLSKKKNGEQKYVYQIGTPQEWKFVTGLIRDLFPTLPPGTVVRIEPDVGSYHKDRDEIILLARQYGLIIKFCDAKLSARRRIKCGIPKDETTDFTDAILIYTGHKDSFGAAKLMSEKKPPLDRASVKKALEVSEERGWTDRLAVEALAFISSEDISARFGPDLAQPVFIVTAYVAARDPQCINRKEFDRFCGLNARARGRGNRGVGSVISSNLSHFNENPRNRTAARYIFHKVKEAGL